RRALEPGRRRGRRACRRLRVRQHGGRRRADAGARDRTPPGRAARAPARARHPTRAMTSLPAGFTLLSEAFEPATSADHLRALLAELHWEEQRFTIYGRTLP